MAKTFFDYSDKEKKEIIEASAKNANKMQAETVKAAKKALADHIMRPEIIEKAARESWEDQKRVMEQTELEKQISEILYRSGSQWTDQQKALEVEQQKEKG